MGKLLVLLTILVIAMTVSSKQIYMSQVYRHGARYPVYDFYDYNQTKQFAGLLTFIGLREHFLLGSYIQNQYIKSKTPLLNLTLKPRQVQFFTMTTPTQRCEQSAYAQALGMFPYGYGEQIPVGIDSQLLEPPFQTIFPSSLISENAPQYFALDMGFQPSPIRHGDTFFPNCPNINVILSKRGQLIAKDLAQFQTQQSIFTDKMRLVFNLTVGQSNVGGVQDLADTLICDKWLNRQLPTAFTDSDFRQIYYIRSFMLANFYAGQVSRTVNAPYINSLLHNMDLKIKNQLGVKKLTSISIHDSNIIPLLTFYNLTSSDCLRKQYKNQTVIGNCVDPIPFASNLIFELHQNDSNINDYFVKVRYNGAYYKLFGKTTLQIEYSQFAAKSRAELMDFNTQCKVKVQNDNSQVLIDQ